MARSLSFSGGIFPPKNLQNPESLVVEELSQPPRIYLPLLQHSGAIANAVVKRGDRVRRGQIIGEISQNLSAAIHSPISGSVSAITPVQHPSGKQVLGIEIENDGENTPFEMTGMSTPWKEAAPQEIIQKILSCGIVGMDNDGFPIHVKLSPPADKAIDTLCIDATQNEPYVASDLPLLIEKTEDILTGVLIAKKVLGATKTICAAMFENTSMVDALKKALEDVRFKDIQLVLTKSKYPQGAEKILVKTLTKRETPIGGSPLDIGCVVLNVSTCYAIFNAVCNGIPLYQRIVTVAGPCVKTPKNLLVPFGTPISYLLRHCDTDMARVKKVIVGGPLRGLAQAEVDVPIIKTSTAVLAFDTLTEGIKRFDCISCGRCVRVCPMRLTPCYLMKFVNMDKNAEAINWGVQDCIECGSCSFVCPSKINLVHFIKLGKYRAESTTSTVKKN